MMTMNNRGIQHHILKKVFKNRAYVLLLLLMCFVQGCMVAAGAIAVGMLAGAGFGVYKVTQLATGGKVEVRFSEDSVSPANQTSLSRLKRIAVWPSPNPYAIANWWPNGGEIKLTEQLQQSGYFEVITPHTVQKTATSLGVSIELTQLTQSERLEAFHTVATALGVDGIIYHALGSWGYDMRPLSWKRGEGTIDFSILVYSTNQHNILWDQPGQFAIIGGRKTVFAKPEGEEMQDILMSAVVEKFLEVTGKRSPTKK